MKDWDGEAGIWNGASLNLINIRGLSDTESSTLILFLECQNYQRCAKAREHDACIYFTPLYTHILLSRGRVKCLSDRFVVAAIECNAVRWKQLDLFTYLVLLFEMQLYLSQLKPGVAHDA